MFIRSVQISSANLNKLDKKRKLISEKDSTFSGGESQFLATNLDNLDKKRKLSEMTLDNLDKKRKLTT